MTKVENKAMNKIKEDALKDGLIEKASKLGIQKLADLFKTFGYQEVTVTVR
mgnify:CR=1 FL=1